MRTCDNCKGEKTSFVKKDWEVTKFQLGWPPIYTTVEEEWWCRRCYYWALNGAAPPEKRRNMHKD